MEYLSEVRMCITKRDMRILKNNLSKIESNILDICDIKKEILGFNNKRYILFGWNDIEWFSKYKEISIIKNTLNEFKNKRLPFKFLRVGQNINDVEKHSFPDESYFIDSIMFSTLMKMDKSA